MLGPDTAFGAWLRRRRRQLDLTQTELAQRVGCSVVTIRKLERDELRPSKQLAERLAYSLDVAVTHRASVVALARSIASPIALPEALLVQRSEQSNLAPQPTPFFGRAAELLELAQYLTDPACRLLTIVGPGGIGKTRLALEVAQALTQQTPHGVYFVSLAALRATEHIVPAIAEAINFRFQADSRLPKQQLLDYLRHKHMLLLLDNFEHLITSIELIHELLQTAPNLRLLVTSRERLRLSSETIFALGGMDFPTGAMTREALKYGAVQLFVATARRIRPKFALHAANQQDIVRICRLVGGMPLGIILAAAWIEVLSPAEIAAELSQGFDFLEAELRDLPDRQRSMRAVLAQSWQRLAEAERAIFMRLAVFRGGFTRPAAQSVAGASLRTLSALVNKSLLQCEPSGRYTIHELLRQYAEAELEAAKQSEYARNAHCTYYTDFLQQHVADLKGHRQAAALDAIEVDFENVRGAWQWAVAQRDYTAVGRALEGLYWFCEMRNRSQEGLELLRLGREQLAPVAGEPPHLVWGQVMARMLGQDSYFYEPPTESRALVRTGLAIAQAHNDQAEVAFCLWRLAVAMYLCNDFIGAIPYFEQSIAQYRALDDRFYLGFLHKDLGILYVAMDQPDKGVRLIRQSLDLRRDRGDLIGLAQSFGSLGWIAYNGGRYTEAEADWQETSELCHRIGSRVGLIVNYIGFAWLALFNRGDLGAVQTLAEESQAAALHIDLPEIQYRTWIMFGILAGMREDYHACHQFIQQAHAFKFSDFPYTRCWELIGLCIAACGLNDIPAAQQHLKEMLNISLIHRWPTNAAKGLTFAAILAAKVGRAERATELLGLVFYHPLSPQGWLEQWPLLTRMRTELAAILTPELFSAAWARGKQLDLMATARAVLAELAESSVDR